MAEKQSPKDSPQKARPARPASSTGKSPARPARRAGSTGSAASAASPVRAKAASKQQVVQAKAAPPETAAALEEEEFYEPTFMQQMIRDSPGWLTSLIVHMALLLIFALWNIETIVKEVQILSVSAADQEDEEEIEEIVPEDIQELDIDVESVTDVEPQPITENIQPEANLADAVDPDQAAVQVELAEIGIETAPQNDLLQAIGSVTGSGMSGRGAAARKALSAKGGGNEASEKAVAMALRWLANHQMADGGWSYAHSRGGNCNGQCSEDGSLVNARNAATAMALLPFLGAGQTHVEGEYQKTVGAGLYYLGRSMKMSKKGGSWHESGGSMYSHGLASIVMCEAYGMTHDKALMGPAQACMAYIINNQDPVIGGWGYGGPGKDTSVAGWQIMALKSGHMAYLHVPPNTVKGIDNFLNYVQADSGASYGYTSPGRGHATTAVGLVCRMYMGWKRDHPALQRGMETMAKQGPSLSNLYRDYYAAQFMFQVTGAEGDMWETWNTKMRDGLVNKQEKSGHATGSWNIKGGHSERAGRIMNTCLATLILEVYYRHMQIQTEAAVETEFPD